MENQEEGNIFTKYTNYIFQVMLILRKLLRSLFNSNSVAAVRGKGSWNHYFSTKTKEVFTNSIPNETDKRFPKNSPDDKAYSLKKISLVWRKYWGHRGRINQNLPSLCGIHVHSKTSPWQWKDQCLPVKFKKITQTNINISDNEGEGYEKCLESEGGWNIQAEMFWPPAPSPSSGSTKAGCN